MSCLDTADGLVPELRWETRPPGCKGGLVEWTRLVLAIFCSIFRICNI